MKKDLEKAMFDKNVGQANKCFCWKAINFREDKRKVIALSIVAIVCLFLIITLVFVLKSGQSEVDDSLFYYPVSESENIFENKAYMSFVRDLRYSYGGVEQLFQYESDYNSGDAYCKFFLDYFKTVINGDYEKISEYYVEGFFESKPQFSKQMIYEPFVFFHSEGTIDDGGDSIKVANFEVRYKIFKNNGTFRKGVGSNQAIPQIYQLVNENGKIKIKNILEITSK